MENGLGKYGVLTLTLFLNISLCHTLACLPDCEDSQCQSTMSCWSASGLSDEAGYHVVTEVDMRQQLPP